MEIIKTNVELWNALVEAQPLTPNKIDEIAKQYNYSTKYVKNLVNNHKLNVYTSEDLFNNNKSVIINIHNNKIIKCLDDVANEIGIKPKTLSKLIVSNLGKEYLTYILPKQAVKIIYLNKNKAKYGIKTQEELAKKLGVSLAYVRRVLYTGR